MAGRLSFCLGGMVERGREREGERKYKNDFMFLFLVTWVAGWVV